MQKAETGSMSADAKSAYISGVLDAAKLDPECRKVCKTLLSELVTEIESNRKANPLTGL